MNRIVITELEHKKKTYTAYIKLNENREFTQLQVFEPEDRTILGNIYVAYVEKVVHNVQAAFVRIADGQKCYLPLENFKSPVFAKKQSVKKPLCEGDLILVQVTKEAVKTKDAVVSTRLSLHGTYCVLTTENTTIGISHKIEEERANELLTLAQDACEGHESKGYGLVLRTNARESGKEDLLADIQSVICDYESLISENIHRQQGELVYRNLPGYLARLKAENLDEVDFIYTDQMRLYEYVISRLPHFRKSGKLKLYDDASVSLAALYNIRGNMDKLLSERVWLPSGANIIIETLETLTVIDVNSGKNTSQTKGSFLSVNVEAAREIARQLQLRNISGMIIIDFINMKSENEREELVNCLKQEFKKDVVPTRFVDITKLGLVEVTRKKVYRSLREILY